MRPRRLDRGPVRALYEVPLTEDMLAKLVQQPGDEPENEDIGPEYCLADLLPFIECLPPMDADIIELIARGCKQRDIAVIFDLTQPGISYRMLKALERLQFERTLATYPSVEDIERDLRPLGLRSTSYDHPYQVDVLLTYMQSTCQHVTAQALGHKANTWIRMTLLRYASQLRKRGLDRYADMIHFLVASKNMRHIVPNWTDARREQVKRNNPQRYPR